MDCVPCGKCGELVSIRAPAGGAMNAVIFFFIVGMFQSAPLREGRLQAARAEGRRCVCFNPRPCGRGDETPR